MDLVALLTTAFREEDRWFMIARASELIAQRAAADRRRTNLYSRLHMLVRLWAGSGSGQLDDAATRTISADKIYVGKDVTDRKEHGDVILGQGDITLDAKTVIIKNSTTVPLGTKLRIGNQ